MSEMGQSGPIIDELLCFLLNKWDNMNDDTIVKLCIGSFNEKEIEASKDILFNILGTENDTTQSKTRRACKEKGKKSENNIRDMLLLLTETGAEEIPKFVAHDLGKLPPITFDHIDVTVLLNKIQNLSTAVDLLKVGMNDMCDTNLSIYQNNLSYENRIKNLENNGIASGVNSNAKSIENENKSIDINIDECENIIDKVIQELPFVCMQCDHRFKSASELSNHCRNSHDELNSNKYSCSVCEMTFETWNDLNEHDGTHKSFDCAVCVYTSENEEDLNTHMLSHRGEKPYACCECDYKFENKDQLLTHEIEHKPYACPDCTFRTASKLVCERHMLTHTEEKPYKCKNCIEKFVSSDELRLHVIVHEPYACTECDFRSASQVDCQTHMLTHTEEKPYGCSKCNEKFVSSEELRLHVIVHEPYACTKCDYRTASHVEYQTHMLKHAAAKLNVCCICDEKYETISELKIHMASHKRESHYSCPHCNYKCNEKENMNRHMNKHKGDNDKHSNNASRGRNGSVSLPGTNGSDIWDINKVARQHLIDSLMSNNDGFSLPFKNGKPMRINDLMRSNQGSPRSGQRKKNSGMIGTGRDSDLSIQNKSFKAVVFASRYKPHSEASTIKRELEADLLRITGIQHDTIVEKIQAKRDHYASFKITCFCENTAVFMNKAVWPPGVYFRWWIRSRQRDDNGEISA